MSFLDKLKAAITANNSHLCIGLDPTLDSLPTGVDRTPEGLLTFNKAIIKTTASEAACFKVNPSFYLQYSSWGLYALEETCYAVHKSGLPLILDGKWGDVPHAATGYAALAYDALGADACTVNPYLGPDSVQPFYEGPERYAFVVCHTTNPGAWVPQNLDVGGAELYVAIARQVSDFKRPTDCGLVLAATGPRAMGQIAPYLQGHWILAPGLGAQAKEGSDLLLGAAMQALGPHAERTIWTLSRAITGASSTADFACETSWAARDWRQKINNAYKVAL